MKKKLSPIPFLTFILLSCIILSIIGNYAGEPAINPLSFNADSKNTPTTSETNDMMIWETVSYHLLVFAR